MKEREHDIETGNILKAIRLAYMLIDEFVEDGQQKEDYLEIMDKVTEELQLNED